MATPEERAKAEAIRDQVMALSPAQRLRLAAELIERGSYGHAEPIVRVVADELTALRLFEKAK